MDKGGVWKNVTQDIAFEMSLSEERWLRIGKKVEKKQHSKDRNSSVEYIYKTARSIIWFKHAVLVSIKKWKAKWGAKYKHQKGILIPGASFIFIF